MPEEEKKTVDIDTSGPETEINVPEEKDEAVIDTAPKEETKEQETVTEETEKRMMKNQKITVKVCKLELQNLRVR